MSNDTTLARSTPFNHEKMTSLIKSALDGFRPGWAVEYSPVNDERDYAMWLARFGDSDRPMFSFWSGEDTHELPAPWPAITAHGGGKSDLENLILEHVWVGIIRQWEIEGAEWRLRDDGVGKYTPDPEPAQTLFDYWHRHYSRPWLENESWPSTQGADSINYYANVRCWMERDIFDETWEPWIGGDSSFEPQIQFTNKE